MKRVALLLTISLFISLTNCSDKPAEKKEDSSTKLDMAQLGGKIELSVIDAYMELKDALVESDSEKASSLAEDFSRVLQADEAELKELNMMVEQLAKAEDIENQRQYFGTISENLYTLIKNQESNEVTIYKQFCPMAFDNEGAFWLSKENAVINPYFGDRMLKCGKVQEIIVASN